MMTTANEATPKSCIFVVDDVPDNHALLTRGLERNGFQTVAFDDGVEALARISVTPPDLLLLDWMMPTLSGIEVLQAVREHYSQDELPVIMCTAMDERTSIGRAMDEGANDYIQKPVNMRVATARIKAQLQRRNALRALSELNQDLEVTLVERTRALMDRTATLEPHLSAMFQSDIEELHRLAAWLKTEEALEPMLLEACSDSLTTLAHRLSSAGVA